MPRMDFFGSSSLRHSSNVALLAIALWGALLPAPQSAWSQIPVSQLTSLFPPGGKQGASLEVTVVGVDLDEAEKIIFSHPGITGTAKLGEVTDFTKSPKPIPGIFKVQIGGDVPPGVYEARVVSRFGISNPRSFCVGTADELTKTAGNNVLDKAMEVPVGPIINGRIDASSRDFYKVTLAKGQRVLVECVAKRIDSKMEPVLALYSADGRELARTTDTWNGDALLDFTAPTAAQYFVSVNDFVYGGSADHFYRLSIHSRPHVDFVFPPSGVVGSNGQYTVYGRNLPGGKPADNVKVAGTQLEKLTVQIAIPADAATVHAPLDQSIAPRVVSTDGIDYRLPGADAAMVYVAKAPVVAEVEPNNNPKAAQKVTVPCEFVGQFYPANDVDWIQFEAKKGDAYIIEVLSHRLGLPSDPSLLLQKVAKNAKGEETVSDVAQVDDPTDRNGKIGTDFDISTDDPSYRFTVGEDATYRLMVRDQFGTGRSDPRMIYRVAIRQAHPDFHLVAVSLPSDVVAGKGNQQAPVTLGSPVIRRGGTAMIQVNIDRTDDFKGEIQVSAEGLPPGVTCDSATIGADGNSASLIFAAAENAAAWAGPIRIVGKATSNGKELVRTARFGTVVWGTANRQTTLPEFRAARDFAVAVNDKETAVAFVQAGDGKTIETSLGANVEIPVKVIRRGEFKDAMKLTATGLPAEIKPAELNIDGKASDGKLVVPLNAANVKAGVYTFYVKGDAKAKYVRNPDLQKSAEEDQKFLADVIAQLDQKVKDTTAANDAATKAKETPEAIAKADADLKEAQKKLDLAKKAKGDADKKVADAKTAMAPKDATYSIISTPITLRVGTTPMKLAFAAPSVVVKQGDKAEADLKLERLFGFADQVEITVEPPKGVAGLSGAKLALAKDKGDGKLEIKAEKNAPPGEHTVTVRAKAKFNNINVESTASLIVNVEKVEAAK